MPRFAAFLRAVNLGPTNKVSSAQLVEEFEAAGLEDVATFRTSGNVVFSAGGRSTDKLEQRIGKQLRQSLDFEVPVFVRSAAEVEAITKSEPFKPAVLKKSKGKLQVLFLEKKPTAPQTKQALALASNEDRLTMGVRELYWLPSGGYLESPIDKNAFGKILGPNTARTMGTVEGVLKKLGND